MIARLSRQRYWLLALLVFVAAVSHTRNSHWIGDFWEHAAVVREFSRHPFAPRHPLLAIDAPHAFASPYALCVGLAARALSLDAPTALAGAGLLNLMLLLVGLRLVARRLLATQHADFYALLFVLFLWGRDPPFFSGFLHLSALGPTLPYPSTFATALLFFSLPLADRGFAARRLSEQLPLSGALALLLAALITIHPPTALAGLVALVAVAASGPGRDLVARGVQLVAIGLVGGSLAVLWPFYPVADFVLGETSTFHAANARIYSGVVSGAAAALLLGLPALVQRGIARPRDPLVLWFVGLMVLYAVGGLSGRWGWGRVLPQLVFCLQLAAAAVAARIERELTESRGRPGARPIVRAVAFAAVLGFGIASSAQGALRYVPLRHRPSARYAFLSLYVPPDAVVITELTTAIAVAAYSGRAIANLRPMAFVPDHERRRADVERFLDLRTSTLDRRRIAGHYRARFLLIDRKRMSVHGDDLRRFLELGRPVFIRPDMILVDMASRPVGDTRSPAKAVPSRRPDRSP